MTLQIHNGLCCAFMALLLWVLMELLYLSGSSQRPYVLSVRATIVFPSKIQVKKDDSLPLVLHLHRGRYSLSHKALVVVVVFIM